MTEHPITPPPELVDEWRRAPEYTDGLRKLTMVTITVDRLQYIAAQAAQYGADQELEACVEWLANARNHTLSWKEATNYSANLRHSRRSKPPSLNKVALQMLDTIERDAHYLPEITDTLRRALEALPE